MSSQLDPLELLAQDFLEAWQKAHGLAAGRASTLMGSDRLAVLIEGAFSQAERKLAEDQSGEALLRHYAAELLGQICEQMSARIREVSGRQVRGSDINVNPEADQIMFIFKLE